MLLIIAYLIMTGGSFINHYWFFRPHYWFLWRRQNLSICSELIMVCFFSFLGVDPYQEPPFTASNDSAAPPTYQQPTY